MALYIGNKKVTPILVSSTAAPNSQNKTITENGVYTASAGYTGLGTVTVNVPNGTETKTITDNGTYTPSGSNIGFSSVTVNVPNSTETKTITDNGTYTPSGSNIGFSSVTVNVEKGITPTGSLDITANGTYDVTNYASAVVNVAGEAISDEAKSALDSMLGIGG